LSIGVSCGVVWAIAATSIAAAIPAGASPHFCSRTLSLTGCLLMSLSDNSPVFRAATP